jgi:hypothetical protein
LPATAMATVPKVATLARVAAMLSRFRMVLPSSFAMGSSVSSRGLMV